MAAARIMASPERPVASHVQINLPMPPSSNRVWATRKGGGMRLSDAYTRWLSDAGWRLQQQRPGRIVGGYALTLFLPAVSRMDQDNAIAGVSDLLQTHRVIDNDRDAEETDLRWHGSSNDLIAVLTPFVGPRRIDRSGPVSDLPSNDTLVRDMRGGRT